MRIRLPAIILISASFLWSYTPVLALGVQTLLASSIVAKQRIHRKALKHFDSLSFQDQANIRKAAYDLEPFLEKSGTFQINLENSQHNLITLEAVKDVELRYFYGLASKIPSLFFPSINISVHAPDLSFIPPAILSSLSYSWDIPSKQLTLFNATAKDIETLLPSLDSPSLMKVKNFTILGKLPSLPTNWKPEVFLIDTHNALITRQKKKEPLP